MLRERAEAVGARFHALDEVAGIGEVEVRTEGTSFRLRSAAWGERGVSTPLVGPHQARNAALAAELLALLPEGVRPGWGEVEAGFATVRWPGRFQVERLGGTTWVFDVAHNPAGVRSLAATLDAVELPRPRVLVAAILSDKEWNTMLPPSWSARTRRCSPWLPPPRRGGAGIRRPRLRASPTRASRCG
ncbi:MAG: hypothetical protein M3P24_05485 [Gemmatimonadota bacterium]|nr:hypothetical protein [Gemmatimonadota bacterium]